MSGDGSENGGSGNDGSGDDGSGNGGSGNGGSGDDGSGNGDSGSTSSSLIRKMRAGRPAAWVRFVRRYSPDVYSHGRAMGLTAEEADDVSQEVLLAVWQSLDRFKRESETDGFRKWLKGITRHKVRDYLRRAEKDEATGGSTARRAIQQAVAPPEGTVDAAAPGVTSLLLRRALTVIEDDFQPNTWRAFWRCAVDGRNATDVADELGMTSANVRKAKSRVLVRLREEYERVSGDGFRVSGFGCWVLGVRCSVLGACLFRHPTPVTRHPNGRAKFMTDDLELRLRALADEALADEPYTDEPELRRLTAQLESIEPDEDAPTPDTLHPPTEFPAATLPVLVGSPDPFGGDDSFDWEGKSGAARVLTDWRGLTARGSPGGSPENPSPETRRPPPDTQPTAWGGSVCCGGWGRAGSAWCISRRTRCSIARWR